MRDRITRALELIDELQALQNQLGLGVFETASYKSCVLQLQALTVERLVGYDETQRRQIEEKVRLYAAGPEAG